METIRVDSKSLNHEMKCYDTISWSKNGFIAYSIPSSNSKDNLLLTYLENVDGKKWQLAKPQKLCVKPTLDGFHSPELSLVSWSNLSTDLAVADVYGNFYILLAGVGLVREDSKTTPPGDSGSPSYELTTYNHLEMIYRDIITNQSNQRPNVAVQFVAFAWLPIEKNQIINTEAKLLNSANSSGMSFSYGYGVEQYRPMNLCHPISTKQACIALRTNGELVLHYQGEHKVEYHKLLVNLNEGYSYNLHIEKVAFGFPNEKKIIVVTYDSLSNKIRTYSVTINWGFLVEAASKQKIDPHFNTPKDLQKSPTLSCCLINEMSPNFKSETEESKPSEYKPKQKIGKLAFIEIISPVYDEKDTIDILIGYEFYDENLKVSTTFNRYKILESSRLISDTFGEIGRKKGAVSDGSNIQKEFNLVYQDKLVLPKRVLKSTNQTSDFLVLCEDGSIESIVKKESKATAWSKNGNSSIPESIRSVMDTGFSMGNLHISGKNPLIIAFSPNGIGAIYTEINEPTTNLKLEFVEKTSSTGISAEELYITAVGFAFQHAFACYCSICSDDILILIQLEVERISRLIKKMIPGSQKQLEATDRFIESILCESHKAINFQLDIFNKESVDKLLSNPPLQKLLSLQLILGGLDYRVNDISENIAWIILNLRSTSFGIMFSLSSIYRQISKKKPTEDTMEDSITRAESIISLIGNVRWLVELIICLNEELLQIYISRKHPESSVIDLNNSIVLPVLLSKVPRLFLMYALSSIGKTHEVLKKLNKDLSDSNKLFTPMKDALNRYFTACANSPLNLNLYESFLRECDTYITTETLNLTKTRPKGHILKMEQQLVCDGKVHEDMVKMGQWIVAKFASNIPRDLKVAEMFYYNVDWLDISYKTSIPRHTYTKHGRIDALRKVLIDAKDTSVILRKCTRCRSISLVNDPLVFSNGTLGLWTMVFQRTCICGSAWVNI
ncbi:hypothetical protein CANTEDRAFT_120811 [Yamadazyma tenuis ATCC 10573]|uniref:Mediator of RNA polymerase II transcription subunit 16 n=1 Tax=Candida tenuis (strain ATCC 10573 / BCRC 21748 / CBS 615 / JCM 9827 / NBRC 10315 / NRRL Y-1498 / VKM Y-70) TaxID=590646 RepID=G3B0T8_CANTC|nr:uncharacterized protein CANTEDRAFT_120811 [Yamadazyma tenuis ATCC 10573]EGV64799.1 hypothetical protein CANTEDRAFT_120811 [Yamadazyma tenuis ATCC 10573]